MNALILQGFAVLQDCRSAFNFYMISSSTGLYIVFHNSIHQLCIGQTSLPMHNNAMYVVLLFTGNTLVVILSKQSQSRVFMPPLCVRNIMAKLS